METILHAYSFDTNTPEGRNAWRAFKAERVAEGARIMGPVFHKGGEATAYDGATISLDPVNLFHNQWATAQGFRAFDWLLIADGRDGRMFDQSPYGIKRGYWLELTDEMRAIRRDTFVCGYCGHKVPRDGAPVFCPACLGSEYLTPEALHLTRLAPVAVGSDEDARPALSGAEADERNKAWLDANRESAKTRAGAKLASFQAAVIVKHEKARCLADAEFNGLMWLIDHDLGGLAQSNAIYYAHTGRFGFGWRHAIPYNLGGEITGTLNDKGFPYPYDIVIERRGKVSSD